MILLPNVHWDRLLAEFGKIRRRVERVGYLDGFQSNEVSVVTTVTVPDAELHPAYFDVRAEAMSEAGKHLRAFRLVRLAQVHTHPGDDTRHSWIDDTRTYSQVPGAVSIVLPRHARHKPGPHKGSVHIREPTGWRELSDGEARALIKIVPGACVFR